MTPRPKILVMALALGLAGCAGTAAPSASVPPAAPSQQTLSPSTPGQSAAASTPPASTAAIPSPAPAARARNGVIVYSDTAGDIHSLDPETDKTTLLIGGATDHLAPWFSPDGKRFVFVRVDDDTLYSANADGSDVQEFGDAKQINNWEWSPRGNQLRRKSRRAAATR